jgi:hypothetical protein
MIAKYSLAWFGIVILAIINGAIRELTYKPFVGDLAAHQISTVTLLILFAVYVWAIGEKWKIGSAKDAWIIGLLWFVMTVAFEFLFGHYVDGQPWPTLFHDYNILAGRVWVIILIAAFVGPYCSYRMRWMGNHNRATPLRNL